MSCPRLSSLFQCEARPRLKARQWHVTRLAQTPKAELDNPVASFALGGEPIRARTRVTYHFTLSVNVGSTVGQGRPWVGL